MVITYYGLSCFKIQSGDTVLAIDPFSKESGLTPPRFGADAVLVSHGHDNHNNVEALQGDIFKITGPGEYEFKNIIVRGIESFHDSKNGKQKGKNTIYVIEWEGMKLAHLGDYGEETLRSETQEALDTPDIMFLPVGGGDTIDGEAAAKLVNEIEPRVIIPMHYKISGLKAKLDGVEVFMKEMGEKTEPEEKLTIKKSGLPAAEESKIVILKTP
ncbi:MAG: MBL fold metallo-hydrolase [Candidatus Giovannonibacteria bacterium]|nr:MAG: MBL fold metallo-hydrolase [Candidatus Giovannonibacteria bacterium]